MATAEATLPRTVPIVLGLEPGGRSGRGDKGGRNGSTPGISGQGDRDVRHLGSPFGQEGAIEIKKDSSDCRLSPLPAPGGQLALPPVRGLNNLGNTCYLNCVLQSVMATPGVREHFLVMPLADEAAAEGELTATLRKFVLELHAHGRPEQPIRPTEMLQAVANLDARYARGDEQDSHELLHQLLEGIRLEEVTRLLANGAAAETEPTTLIDDIYAGEIRSSVVCLGCGGVSCSTDLITDLSLSIPHSRPGVFEAPLEPPTLAARAATVAREGEDGVAAADGGAAARKMHEMRERVLAKLPRELKVPPAHHEHLELAACLQSFCTLETLEGENAYSCNKCTDTARAEAANAGLSTPPLTGQPALKWLQVARTPRALTLHLKRFRSAGSKMLKVDAVVRFPLVLDLSPYTCADTPVAHLEDLEDHSGAPSAEVQMPKPLPPLWDGWREERDASGVPYYYNEKSDTTGQDENPKHIKVQMKLYGVVQHEGSFEKGHCAPRPLPP